jgi:peptide chain release factor 1
MRQQLAALEAELNAIEAQLSDPETAKDSGRLQALMRRYGELVPIVERYRQYKQLLERERQAREILETENDEDLLKLARDELDTIVPQREALEAELAEALMPKDPNEGKDVVMEIRAGTGGEEAALFARDLCRMYLRYAERKGWKVEIVYENPSALGGYKEVILHISGKDAWKLLRHESGVHRVQRVPVTESSGRIHTSAATVAVLPEAEEAEVALREDDLEIETFRSSGPGGQHMQKKRDRCSHPPQADGHRRGVPRRTQPAPKQDEGVAHPADAPVGDAATGTRGCLATATARANQVGRPQRQRPHLQLHPKPRH